MSKIEDGWAAFPVQVPAYNGVPAYINEGISLRDWFAGQALAGILAHDSTVSMALLHEFGSTNRTRCDAAAQAAYAFAASMLEARKEKP